jgi:hypothetical protein
MTDANGDLAHLLALHRGVTGADLLPAAYLLARKPAGRRLRRALARSGHRGALLGLHLVPGLVLVDVLEHGAEEPPTLAPGHVVALVYGGDVTAALEIPEEHRPAGVVVAVVWRPARLVHHLRAWWRQLTWRPPT